MAKRKNGKIPNIEDVLESIIGAFSAVLFFFALRGGSTGPYINNIIGLIISIVWIGLLFQATYKVTGISHFLVNLTFSFILCGALSIAFNLTTLQESLAAGIFGSPIMITTWMALPIAILFDIYNIKDVLSRYWIRGS